MLCTFCALPPAHLPQCTSGQGEARLQFCWSSEGTRTLPWPSPGQEGGWTWTGPVELCSTGHGSLSSELAQLALVGQVECLAHEDWVWRSPAASLWPPAPRGRVHSPLRSLRQHWYIRPRGLPSEGAVGLGRKESQRGGWAGVREGRLPPLHKLQAGGRRGTCPCRISPS